MKLVTKRKSKPQSNNGLSSRRISKKTKKNKQKVKNIKLNKIGTINN